MSNISIDSPEQVFEQHWKDKTYKTKKDSDGNVKQVLFKLKLKKINFQGYSQHTPLDNDSGICLAFLGKKIFISMEMKQVIEDYNTLSIIKQNPEVVFTIKTKSYIEEPSSDSFIGCLLKHKQTFDFQAKDLTIYACNLERAWCNAVLKETNNSPAYQFVKSNKNFVKIIDPKDWGNNNASSI